jgi:dienelactone hydrolase
VRLEARDEGRHLLLAEHAGGEALLQHALERRAADQRTKVEQLGRGRQVVHRLCHHIRNRQDVVPHAQPRVPQRIEHLLHQRQQRIGRAGRQEADVQVALPAEQTAAVAAHGAHQQSAVAPLEVGARVEPPQQGVGTLRVAARQHQPGAAGTAEQRAQLRALLLEIGAHRRRQRRAAALCSLHLKMSAHDFPTRSKLPRAVFQAAMAGRFPDRMQLRPSNVAAAEAAASSRGGRDPGRKLCSQSGRILNSGETMQLRTTFLALCLALQAFACAHSGSSSPAVVTAEAAAKVTTREVTYASDGLELKGFLAYPPGDEKRPGVLVVHEWWGLNDYVRSRARQLAALGYVALALDMYGGGKHTEHPDQANKFMMAALKDLQDAQKRFMAAQELLANDPRTDGDKLAAIGYCFGGATVLHMARAGDDKLKLVASFHGNLATQRPMEKGVFSGKLFVAQGAADPFVPPEQVEAFKKEMDAAGADYELVEYAGAKHAFTNPDATALGKKFNLPLEYNAQADAASWQRLIELLKKL